MLVTFSHRGLGSNFKKEIINCLFLYIGLSVLVVRSNVLVSLEGHVHVCGVGEYVTIWGFYVMYTHTHTHICLYFFLCMHYQDILKFSATNFSHFSSAA